MQVFKVSLGSGQIEYSLVGTGKPILILHGGHSNCRETLSHKGLDQNNFQLITPSRPGYGNTPLGKNTSPESAANLLCELLDSLQIEKVLVLGVSAGGPTAIAFASLFPNRIDKLVLASAVTKKWMDLTDTNYKKAQKIFHPKMEKITWFFLRTFVKIMPSFIAKSMFEELSTLRDYEIQNQEKKSLKSMLLKQGSGSGFLNDLSQVVDENGLERIVCPTLIVHSENDHAVDITHALHASKKIPHSKLMKTYNSWGHLIWLGPEADEILSKINSFFSGESV